MQKKSKFSFKDLGIQKFKNLKGIENFLNNLPDREFGKYMSEIIPFLIRMKINNNNKKYKVKFEDRNMQGNAKHYDLYYVNKNIIKYKIQVKFRSVNGKTPFSKKIYLHNWRQKYQYNKNDFDSIVVVLSHNGNRNPKDWIISFIKINYLYIKKSDKIKTDIPKELLEDGTKFWKKQLLNHIKELK